MSRVDLCASVDVDDAADRVAEGGGVPAGRRALPHRSLLAPRETKELADRRQLVEHLKRKRRERGVLSVWRFVFSARTSFSSTS